MRIEERMIGEVLVIAGEGKLTIGKGDVAFREAVHQAIADGKTRVVFDMSSISAIDSSGVGELVANHVSLRNRGGRLALLRLSDRVGGVLKATQLTGVLDIFESEADAVSSFL